MIPKYRLFKLFFFNLTPFENIFFHTIPILFYKKFYLNALSLSIDLKLFIIALITSIILFFNFDYNLDFAGGGIFLHASHFIFDNNLLFFVILPILLFFVLKIISISYNNLRNTIYFQKLKIRIDNTPAGII